MSQIQSSQSILSKFRHLNIIIQWPAVIFCRLTMDQTNSASVTRVIRRVYCINLPTLQDDDTIIRHHYKVWCKWKRNMSRSIANRTPYNDHVCCSCVHPSLTACHLRRHEPHCMQFPPQMVKYLYPDGHTEDLIVNFHTCKKQTSVVFLSRVQLLMFSYNLLTLSMAHHQRSRRWRWRM